MSLVEMDELAASDDALVLSAQHGDQRAFAALYRRYQPDIKALCSRALPDPHIAEDVTQETFLRALRHIGEFESGRRLWPWLATIAKRLCVDEQRGTRRRAVLARSLQASDTQHDSTSEEALAHVDRQRLGRMLSAALGALRPRDRSVFVLHNVEGWSHEEIAERHGMSVHAVRNLAWRVRKRLRHSLRHERRLNWGWFLPVSWQRRERGVARTARLRMRCWMNTRLEHVAAERAAAIVLSLAAATVTLLGPSGSPSRPPSAAISDPPRVAVAPGHALASRAPVDPVVPGRTRRASRPSVVGASLVIADRHPGAAAPSNARTRIEVTTPDGRMVAWYEVGLACGAQGGSVLPRSSPVKVVC